MLRDNSHGGQPEVVEFAEAMVWQDHPRRAVNHVCQFIAKEVEELVRRLMGAALDGMVALGEGPRWGGKDDRETVAAEVSQ